MNVVNILRNVNRRLMQEQFKKDMQSERLYYPFHSQAANTTGFVAMAKGRVRSAEKHDAIVGEDLPAAIISWVQKLYIL